MGMTHEVTQHSTVFSVSYQLKKGLQKTKTGESYNKKRRWRHAKLRRKRKKGSRQVLPRLASVSDCYPTTPLQSSSVLPRRLPWLSVVTLHILSSKFSYINIPKSDVLVQIKKEIPFVLLTEDWVSILPIKNFNTMKKLLFSFLINNFLSMFPNFSVLIHLTTSIFCSFSDLYI